MNNKFILPSFITGTIVFAAVVSACNKDVAPPAAPINYSWVEEFDTVQNAVDRGWVITNNSRNIGTESWVQGQFAYDALKKGFTGFPAQSYSYSGLDFAVCTFNAADSGTISAWLISPPTVMKNGDQIVFYTRTYVNPATYPDRLRVRLNPTNNSVNVGSGRLSNLSVANMVGDFSQLLLDINPSLIASGAGSYPAEWTKYTLTLNGLPAPVERRFAFRYFVTDGGTVGANSQAVGVDSVAFVSR